MDRAPITFPAWRAATDPDPLEREEVEVDAAIDLVLAGVATRVQVANLSRPEAAAAHAAATANGLPIRVSLVRGDNGTGRTVCIERRDGNPGRAP